ncbi:MAG TPA: TIGR03435 family protein [Acidobacteriaceae bacterium]|nr:TIGR03435 family protein [Acidobacteriaceae bacterium]
MRLTGEEIECYIGKQLGGSKEMGWRLEGGRWLMVGVGALLCGGCLAVARAQDAGQGWEKAAGGEQRFEVASVRENKKGGGSSSNFDLDGAGNMYWVMDRQEKTAPEGSLFRATNQPLMRYIIFAYKLTGTEELALRGAAMGFPWGGLGMKVPAWVSDTRYDIEARAPGAATKDQMRLMMQSLLEERFKLVVHRETRQAPVFALVVERPGTLGPELRVHPASDTCAGTAYPDADGKKDGGGSWVLPIPCGMIARLPVNGPEQHRIGGRNVTLAMVAASLPAQTGLATFPEPVVDRTGLAGTYDLTLEWTQVRSADVAVGPSAQGEEAGPPIAQALKRELGLKVEATKGPVEVLVVDRVERPSGN